MKVVGKRGGGWESARLNPSAPVVGSLFARLSNPEQYHEIDKSAHHTYCSNGGYFRSTEIGRMGWSCTHLRAPRLFPAS